MRVAIAVAFSWEVDPLGVAKLVAHEVEVGFTAQGHGDEANHLVKSHASADHD